VNLAPTTRPSLSARPIDAETLVRRHQVGVWRYLRALGAAADEAEDLLQETFLVALDKLTEDLGTTSVASFLRKTARHLLLRQRRDRGRREAAVIAFADELWQRDCAVDDGGAWLEALDGCVSQLDGRSRDVVQWFYREGQSRKQVAARLQIKETGMKTLLQRLRAALRSCIEARLQGERA